MLFLAIALALGLRAPAHAATPGVELEVSASCERIDTLQLRRLLKVEERRDAEASIREIRVGLSCDERAVTLRVERRDATTPPRSRELEPADVSGEVGARVLSLAAIELINDLTSAPPAPPAPPEPEKPPPAPPPTAAAPTVRLMAGGAISSFELERPLAGGGISVDFLRLSRLGLRLELGVAVGSRAFDLGSARVQLTTLSAQAGYLAIHESWTARAFAGYRFGNGRIVGERAPGSQAREGTVSGACGGPLISGGLGIRSGGWVAEIAAELGLVSFPLEGRIDEQAPVRLDGYWLGFSANVGALL